MWANWVVGGRLEARWGRRQRAAPLAARRGPTCMKQMIQYYNPRVGVLRIGLGYKAGVSHNFSHFSDLSLHVVRHLNIWLSPQNG